MLWSCALLLVFISHHEVRWSRESDRRCVDSDCVCCRLQAVQVAHLWELSSTSHRREREGGVKRTENHGEPADSIRVPGCVHCAQKKTWNMRQCLSTVEHTVTNETDGRWYFSVFKCQRMSWCRICVLVIFVWMRLLQLWALSTALPTNATAACLLLLNSDYFFFYQVLFLCEFQALNHLFSRHFLHPQD